MTKGERRYSYGHRDKETTSYIHSKDKAAKRYNYVHPSKKKKSIALPLFLGTLVLIFIFIGGYLLLQPVLNNTNISNTNNISGVGNASQNSTNANNSNLLVNDSSHLDLIIYNSALKQNNYTICWKISNASLKDKCYAHFSNQSLDACVNIVNVTLKYPCITKFAKSKHMFSICDKLGTNNSQLVLKCKKYVDICYGLNGTVLSTCKAEQYNDSTLCERNTDCLLNFSLYQKDPSYCDEMSGTYNKYACRSYILKSDYCKNLNDDSNTKQMCYMKLAEYTSNASYCKYTTEYTYAQNECYYRVALKSKDMSLCEKEDLTYRWKCYEDYAEKYKDPKGCMKIDPLAEIHYNNCFIHLSIWTHNASLCEYLPIYLKERCYASAVYGNLTYVFPVSNCEGIKDVSWKNACFKSLVERTNDTSYCNYIQDDGYKQICLNAIK